MRKGLQVIVGVVWAGAVYGAVPVDSSWTLVVGDDPLERTAAEDLRQAWRERWGVELRGPMLAAPEGRSANVAQIVIGTAGDNPLVAAAAAERPFAVSAAAPEGYHAELRARTLFVVGATAKGAMNGVYRFDDRRTRDVEGYDVHEAPAFRYRVAGHRMNQTPPPDWSEEDQARYFARHYINVVWGEKMGEPLSLAARRKYGLGLMAEVRFPPVDEAWRNDPANAAAVYRLSPERNWKVVSPFEPAGREAYRRGFEQFLARSPDLRVLYGVFGDYNAIPDEKSVRISDGQPYGHTREEGMIEILRIMKEVCGDRDILQEAWMWHAFFGQDAEQSAFMQKIAAMGFGAVYNEAGNSDCWIFKRDNFDATALKAGADGKAVYGPAYMPLVSAGGACESINPVIGIPLPMVAGGKIARLADAGVQNFCIWWAGYEGWVYQPNNEIVSEIIWQPRDRDAALRRIAGRDFGEELAQPVLNFWQKVDEAVVTDVKLYQPVDRLPRPEENGLHIYDWYQRMGIFTEAVFGGAFSVPLTPAEVGARKEATDPKDKGWMKTAHAQANYAAVIARLKTATDELQAMDRPDLRPDVRRRLGDMYRWTELYRHLLVSQYDFMRAVDVMYSHRDEDRNSPAIRQAMQPIARDEIRNDESLIALLGRRDGTGGFAPNFNVRMGMEGAWENRGSLADECALLESKIAAMRIWLDDLPNVALRASVTASSQEKPELAPAAATDGDAATRWGSEYSDSQWIEIDMGGQRELQYLSLRWNAAYAKSYRILADSREIYRTETGGGGTEIIHLEQPVTAQRIRIEFSRRATGWGYSLYEIGAFPPAKRP